MTALNGIEKQLREVDRKIINRSLEYSYKINTLN